MIKFWLKFIFGIQQIFCVNLLFTFFSKLIIPTHQSKRNKYNKNNKGIQEFGDSLENL